MSRRMSRYQKLQHNQNNLSVVLRNSRCKAGSVMIQNVHEINNKVFKNIIIRKNDSNFKLKAEGVTHLIQKLNNREIQVLHQKKDLIIKAFNKVKNDIKKYKIEIKKYQLRFSSKNRVLGKEIGSRNFDKIAKIQKKNINLKICEMKQNLKHASLYEHRYEAIIDICVLNRSQNEKCIKNLNFYLQNLKDLCYEKKNNIQEFKQQSRVLKKSTLKLYLKYKQNKFYLEKMLIRFKKYLVEKNEIDKAMVETDQIIMKENKNQKTKVKPKKIKINQSLLNQNLIHHQNQQYFKRNKLLEGLIFPLSPLFTSFKSENDFYLEIDDFKKNFDPKWHEKEEFKELMYKIERGRKIKERVYIIQSTIEEHRRKVLKECKDLSCYEDQGFYKKQMKEKYEAIFKRKNDQLSKVDNCVGKMKFSLFGLFGLLKLKMDVLEFSKLNKQNQSRLVNSLRILKTSNKLILN